MKLPSVAFQQLAQQNPTHIEANKRVNVVILFV